MIDSLVVELLDMLQRERIRRVAIDGLTELTGAATSAERFHDYVYSIVQRFRTLGVTALATVEAPASGMLHDRRHWTRVSALCDGLLTLGHPASTGKAWRELRVVKMRGSDHPLESRPFVIRKEGIRMGAEAEP